MTDQAQAARPSRPVLATIGWVLFVPGAGLAIASVLQALKTDPALTPDMELGSDVIVIVLGSLPALLGLMLIRSGSPGLLARLRAGAAAALTPGGWRAGVLRLWESTIGRVLLGLAIVAVASIIAPRGTRWLSIFLVLTAYSILDPIFIALRPRWWLNAALCLVGWFVLFITAAAISDADGIREGAMVFLLPMMIFPPMIAVSGLIRLVRWRMAQTTGVADAARPA